LPCIVSDINGCNEIITASETGMIVPPKNTEALTSAMKQLSEDEQMRQRFGKAARAFVARNYGRRIVWEGLLGEYRAPSNSPSVRGS
jgi:glycosyltransferase involved in cell wall biosynthesis